MADFTHEFEYLVALGSNLGDRRLYLSQARDALSSDAGPLVAIAGIYDTAPIGAADQQFLNSALVLSSPLNPKNLLLALLAIEVKLGRVRDVHWGNRTIDLDIIMARRHGTSLTMTTPSLTIPHPRLLERDFVLCPGAEIAPEWVHPGTKNTLANECRARHFSLTPQPDTEVWSSFKN
jgi:2-amino-4-hydroxy-6-hydroxymethyldihydropteridine diphosphokinase